MATKTKKLTKTVTTSSAPEAPSERETAIFRSTDTGENSKFRAAILLPKYESKPTKENADSLEPVDGHLTHYAAMIPATSSGSESFHHSIVCQLKGLGGGSLNTLNSGLAFVGGLKPKDEIETLLMTQMFAAHHLSMRFAALAMANDLYPETVDRYAGRFERLTSRFAEQMDALNKHRGKGQQKVTVEHVTVNSGGQAIVGVVKDPGGSHGK
jgi:hypothetical protein